MPEHAVYANGEVGTKGGMGKSFNAPRFPFSRVLPIEKELEKRSKGRIDVENYFGAVLGNEREMMDMVATGALQGTRGGMFTDANPKFVIFMMPFLVNGWEQATKLVQSDWANK